MPSLFTALRTFEELRSSGSSGVCTLITCRPRAPYSACTASTQGSVLRQLEHSKAQNSTSTTFPRNDAIVSGAELTQSLASECVNSGASVAIEATLAAQQISARNAAVWLD